MFTKQLLSTLKADLNDLSAITDVRLWTKKINQNQYDKIQKDIQKLYSLLGLIDKETDTFETYLSFRNSFNDAFYPIEQYGMIDFHSLY